MTPQFIAKNHYLLRQTFNLWIDDAMNNAQYGSGIFGGGDIRTLEKKFCTLFKAQYSVAMASGTAALHGALVSLNIKKNSNVIILGSKWIGLKALILAYGAKPVFLEYHHFVSYVKKINFEGEKQKLVLIYVREAGDDNFLKKVYKICLKNSIPLIEDWSALREINLWDNDKICAPVYGDFAVFSFGYNKWIQAGEGGIILLNRKYYFEKIMCFSQHPISQKAHSINNFKTNNPGLNYRLHPLAARLVLMQLSKYFDVSLS